MNPFSFETFTFIFHDLGGKIFCPAPFLPPLSKPIATMTKSIHPVRRESKYEPLSPQK